jgi:hypothetical protein
MDGSQFDRIARSLAGGASRRGVIGGLAALAAGVVGVRATEAQTCPPDQVRRARFGCVCRQTGRPPVGGRCCPVGTTACGTRCVDLMTDPVNCGACGTRCQLNGVCDQGTCACLLGCNDYEFGFQCCPEGNAAFAACSCGLATFTDPLTCLDLTEDACPPAQRCVGPFCKACCPLNSACDPSTGTCVRTG